MNLSRIRVWCESLCSLDRRSFLCSQFHVEFGDRFSKPSAMASRRFPVTSKQLVTTIQGQKTEVVQCCYDDHIMVIVTQIGKMGTLLHARKEEGYGTAPTFNVNILMGKRDEPLMVACARQLIEQISKGGSTRPLILSLGLSDHSAGTLKEIIQVIVANKIW